MKFACDRGALLAALEIAARTAPSKGGIPATMNALVTADGGCIEVAATDLIIDTRSSVPATVEASGQLCANAAVLLDAVKGMGRGPVTIDVRDGTVTHLRSGRRDIRTTGIDPEGFPALRPFPDAAQSIPSAVLLSLLKRTTYAMCTDTTRPHLSGVRVETEPGRLIAVATDGHRLAFASIEIAALADVAFLIPEPLAVEVERLIGVTESPHIEFAAVDGMAHFRLGDTTLGGKLYEGAYPLYRQIMPQGHPHTARVTRMAVIESLRAMTKVAGDRSSKLVMLVRSHEIDLSMSGTDRGDAHDVVDAEVRMGGEAEVGIGLSAEYLIDALAAIDDDEAEIAFAGPLDPIIVRPVGSDTQMCVVMPMRI